jgi:hypothetical protein
LVERANLLLEQRKTVQRAEHEVGVVVGPRMLGDLLGADNQAERVDRSMPLAALDQVSRIKAARAATLSRFHALTVENAHREAGFAL